jgi:hypothetical protein
VGIELLAPYSSSKRREPNPKRSAFLSRFRYRIDTAFSQLTVSVIPYKRVWARDVCGTWQADCFAQSPLTPFPSCSTIGWAIHLCN